MVLESMIPPLGAEKTPWKTFFLGFLYASVAAFLALLIFKGEASMVMVFLIVIACLPLIVNTARMEENKDLEITSEKKLLHEHNRAIAFLMYLFLGVTVACVLLYVALPADTVNDLFRVQSETIGAINNREYTANAINSLSVFSVIFFNNLKVLSFAVLFAFIYGAGAMFILTWNATVIGTAIGNFIRTNIDTYVATITLFGQDSYFHIVSLGLLKYAIHGIPEIAAYFYGGLAGSIISVAIIRKHFKTPHFRNVMVDVSELVLIAVAFLMVAAFLEVYVTPMLF